VVVVLSDGYDTAAQKTLEESLESALRADVVIYGIAPTGGEHAPSPAARVGAAALRRLCEQTGGVAFFPPVAADAAKEAADLDVIYRRVADEIRAQYVLTYYSAAPARDGRFRSLRVEVKRPGLTVTARKGYYAR
jgi:Ca-activated chloride channel family protein